MRIRSEVLYTALALCAVFALSLAAGIAWAGATAGERSWGDVRLGANASRKYYIQFEGQEEARVAAVACCKNDDIDIRVFDADGEIVVSDVLDDHQPLCKWTPDATAVYTVKIINCEDYPVTAAVAHN